MREDSYAHWCEIPTRWKDNDVYGHLNNVVHYSFMDTAINTWLIEHGGLDIEHGTRIGVCVQSHCEYRAAAAFPDVLSVGLRVAHLGRTSVRYEIGMYRADETLVAEGHFVHVFVDRTSRQPVEIEPKLRAALGELMPS